MPKAMVGFADARSEIPSTSIIEKTKSIFDATGLAECIKKGDKVALRVHFGELGSTRYLRPVIVRAVVDKVKELGGEPFVAETLTIHAGPWASRTTADDLLRTAAANGFTIGTMGCPIVPGDGWFGTDDIAVATKGSILEKAYVAKAFAMADAMIVISHVTFSSSIVTCALKKVGIGCLSKRGKYLVHFELDKHPHLSVQPDGCPGKECQWSSVCETICPYGALTITDHGIRVQRDLCRTCALCLWLCAFAARPPGQPVLHHPREEPGLLGQKIAEAASAVISTFKRGKIGYLGYLFDITPKCDCFPWSDVPVIDDIGILGARDPVAIETAAVDKIYGNIRQHAPKNGKSTVPPESLSRTLIQRGEALGLGQTEYDLVEVTPSEKRPIPGTSRYIKRMYKEKPDIIRELGL